MEEEQCFIQWKTRNIHGCYFILFGFGDPVAPEGFPNGKVS